MNETLRWFEAPTKTEWGSEMVVAHVGLTKDNTLDLYCEKEMIPLVQALFDKLNGES